MTFCCLGDCVLLRCLIGFGVGAGMQKPVKHMNNQPVVGWLAKDKPNVFMGSARESLFSYS